MATYAEVVAEVERLIRRNGGILPPAALVEAARPEDSVLHDQFEWDNGAAAEKWREEQARRLMRVTVMYRPAGREEPIRHNVGVSLMSDRVAGGGYRLMVDVLADEGLRAELVQDALRELAAFREKYQHLTELAQLFEAMSEIEREVAARVTPADTTP